MSKRIRAAEEAVRLWDSAPHVFPATAGHSMVYRPDTPLQALMETAPNEIPADNWESQHEKRENVADLIDGLNEVEQFVITSLFYERLSLRATADIMLRDKNWVARIRDGALEKMGNTS